MQSSTQIITNEKALRETQTLRAAYAGGSVLHLCTKFEADSCFRSKVIWGVKNFEIGSHDRPHPFTGQFRFSTQARSAIHLCTKFEVDCSIRSKFIKGVPKWENLVTWPRPLMGRFMVPMYGGSVLYVWTKYEADSTFRSKVFRGSQNYEIGSPDPGHAHLGVVLFSIRRRGPSSVPVPNLKRIAQFIQKLLRGSRN